MTNEALTPQASETGFIDNASYRDINQVDTLTASGHLRHLRDQDLLEKRGKGSKTYYLPGPKYPKPDNRSGKPDNLSGKPDNLSGKPDNLPEKPDELLAVPELLSQMPKRLRDMVLGIGKKAPKENLRHAILALCQWKEMTAAQFAGILRRNRTFLLGEHIKPMVDAGDLQMKYPQENHPQQAYRAKIAEEKD
jgi:ATP-dependent DNA helicase RecG